MYRKLEGIDITTYSKGSFKLKREYISKLSKGDLTFLKNLRRPRYKVKIVIENKNKNYEWLVKKDERILRCYRLCQKKVWHNIFDFEFSGSTFSVSHRGTIEDFMPLMRELIVDDIGRWPEVAKFISPTIKIFNGRNLLTEIDPREYAGQGEIRYDIRP